MGEILMTRSRFWACVLALAALAIVLVGFAPQVKAAEVVDVKFQQLYFDYAGHHTNIVCNEPTIPQTPTNCGKYDGDQVLWTNLITVNGVTVDALVTTTINSAEATIEKYGTTAAATKTPGDFLADVRSLVVNGFAAFKFTFYESGTYPDSPKALTLNNVQVTAKDIDLSQFNSFVGVRGYTTSAPTTALTVTNDTTPSDNPPTVWPANLTFQGPSTGGANLGIHQAVVSFSSIPETEVLMGSGTISNSFFALAWAFTTFKDSTGTGSQGQAATVTYDSNGATSGTAPAKVVGVFGQIITVATGSSITKSGYTFANWNTAFDGSGTAYTPGASLTIPVTGITLYAQWVTATLKVKVMSTGPQVGSLALIDEVYDGVKVELSADNGVTWMAPVTTPLNGEVDFGTVAAYTTYWVKLTAPCGNPPPIETHKDLVVTTGDVNLTRTLAATAACAPSLSYSGYSSSDSLSWTEPNDGGSRIRYYTYHYNPQARIDLGQAWGIFCRFWPANLRVVSLTTYGTGTPPGQVTDSGSIYYPSPYMTPPQCPRPFVLGELADAFFHWRVAARNATSANAFGNGIGWGPWSNIIITNRTVPVPAPVTP